MNARMAKNVTVMPLAGGFRQGEPLIPTEEEVELPAAYVTEDELVYHIQDFSLQGFDIEPGDLVVAEYMGRAHTGELVLARLDEQYFIGRWWAKHGRRDVTGPDGQTVIARGVEVLAIINLIIRRSQ